MGPLPTEHRSPRRGWLPMTCLETERPGDRTVTPGKPRRACLGASSSRRAPETAARSPVADTTPGRRAGPCRLPRPRPPPGAMAPTTGATLPRPESFPGARSRWRRTSGPRSTVSPLSQRFAAPSAPAAAILERPQTKSEPAPAPPGPGRGPAAVRPGLPGDPHPYSPSPQAPTHCKLPGSPPAPLPLPLAAIGCAF